MTDRERENWRQVVEACGFSRSKSHNVIYSEERRAAILAMDEHVKRLEREAGERQRQIDEGWQFLSNDDVKGQVRYYLKIGPSKARRLREGGE